MNDTAQVRSRVPWLRVMAEFLVIFAGVTLSLLADDWRQRQGDRAQETALLAGMHADLAADSANISSVWQRGETWERAAVRLRLRMESSDDLPPDSVFAYLQPVVWRTTYQPVTATYASLKAGGGLMALIRDVELRRLIAAYYEVYQPAAVDNYAVAIASNDKLRSYRFWEVPLVDTTSRYWPVRQFRLTREWTHVAGDLGFRGSVFELGVVGGDMATTFGSLLERNQTLRAAINRALGGSASRD